MEEEYKGIDIKNDKKTQVINKWMDYLDTAEEIWRRYNMILEHTPLSDHDKDNIRTIAISMKIGRDLL